MKNLLKEVTRKFQKKKFGEFCVILRELIIMQEFKETLTTSEEILCKFCAGNMWANFNYNLFPFLINYGENVKII